jgi:oxygen-dependent protoporphyrinogen oxidase
MSNVDVLIVGGGISGLATAAILARKGVSVEVWEQAARPGGKIGTHEIDGYSLESAATMVLNFLPEVRGFLAATGLQDYKTLRRPTAARYIVHDGRLVPVPTKLGEMVTSRLWSTRGKLRLLAEPFIRRGGHERETVSEFIARRLGTELLTKVMGPYIAGPLASDPHLANAYACLPRLTALEKRYGSLTAGVFAHRILKRRSVNASETFSFAGGMTTLVDALGNNPAVDFRYGNTATELVRDGKAWVVSGATPQSKVTCRARQIILSVPAYVAANLVGAIDPDLAGSLKGIDYAPVTVVHTGFPSSATQHPLDGGGFLTPPRSGFAANGCLWMSSLFPDRAPAGKILLTSYLGGACNPSACTWDDRDTLARTMDTLEKFLGLTGDPEMVQIVRHPRALPLYHNAYCDRLGVIEERIKRLPGLHLEANYRGGISIRDRIVCAHNAAERVLKTLEPPAYGLPPRTLHPDLSDDVFAPRGQPTMP